MKSYPKTLCSPKIGCKTTPRPTSWTRVAPILASLVLLLSVGLRAQDSDQPLGDIARQGKASRKAARLVTNDEIPSVTTDPGPQASTSTAETNDRAIPDKASTADRGEARGTGAPGKGGITVPGVLARGTLQEAQSLLESLKHDRQLLIDNYDKIERKLAETNDESLRQTYSESLARRDARLAEKDKSIAQLENAIRTAQDAQGGNNETQ